ncbi:hypothetical protein M427DRAFT_130535 [Gonapodya prolifera JEL478]|uniref:Uncharacterized protein n=1 Tax=Gonapodya prolifera (strain JEL478) TaxID=1344416 RepID=A0A139AYL1_GONPJ|nr:hypothetical protein M427DRAFT_130535 [Gonapodya prolifera JEL478]|eukprot:KXS21838.1 hypothetical protein M427DRAFT_130535 [Gonapodya prolifera JEL478]
MASKPIAAPLAPSQSSGTLVNAVPSETEPLLAREPVTTGELAIACAGGICLGAELCILVIIAVLQAFLTIGILVATIAVPIMTEGETCDQPLRTFVIAYGVIFCILSMSVSGNYARKGDTSSLTWGNLLAGPLSIALFVFFVFGNIWLFKSETCKETSPLLWWTTFGYIAFGWAKMVAVPCILLSIFCSAGLLTAVLNRDAASPLENA